MADFKFTFEAPELSEAINRLADAIFRLAPKQPNDSPKEAEPIHTVEPPKTEEQPKRAYTMAQVSKAGADLIGTDASMMPKLMELLSAFGVQAITQLSEDKIDAFGAALKELGAEL